MPQLPSACTLVSFSVCVCVSVSVYIPFSVSVCVCVRACERMRVLTCACVNVCMCSGTQKPYSVTGDLTQIALCVSTKHRILCAAIDEVRKTGDSCGGEVTCVVRGCPVGLGAPVFDKLEAELAKAIMSLPATKVCPGVRGVSDKCLTVSHLRLCVLQYGHQAPLCYQSGPCRQGSEDFRLLPGVPDWQQAQWG